MAFAFLGVQLAVFGLYMDSSFAPNHVGMPIVPRDAKLDFLNKQVRTSRNISGGWWATALMAGSTTRSSTTSSRACLGRVWPGRGSSSGST